MTATELGGPMQKPHGHSELGSLVCKELLLWLKSCPLKSLGVALDLVLNTGSHLCRNEPHLRREQDGRLSLPAWLQFGRSWERGEEAVCQCQAAPAPACLAHLGEPACSFWWQNSHTMFIMPCLLLCTWGQAVLNPATLPCAVPCPGGGNQKVHRELPWDAKQGINPLL